MNGFDLFIDSIEDQTTKDILVYLHVLILDIHPGMNSKIRYNIPFYDIHSWICYTNPLKKEGVELCFIHGQQLSDPYGLLDEKDRKMISGITITTLDDAILEAVLFYLTEAIEVDSALKK